MSVWLIIFFLMINGVVDGAPVPGPGLTVTRMPDRATCQALVAHLAQRGVRAECVELIQS